MRSTGGAEPGCGAAGPVRGDRSSSVTGPASACADAGSHGLLISSPVYSPRLHSRAECSHGCVQRREYVSTGIRYLCVAGSISCYQRDAPRSTPCVATRGTKCAASETPKDCGWKAGRLVVSTGHASPEKCPLRVVEEPR